jgi:hypothetical protein
MRYFDIGRMCITNIVQVYMMTLSLENNGTPGKSPFPIPAERYSIGAKSDHFTLLNLRRKWTTC